MSDEPTDEQMAQLNAELCIDVVHSIREMAKTVLGFNTTFADDDMRVIILLAQRAVLAGLASDFSPDMQRRFMKAAEPHRADHEASLRRTIEMTATVPTTHDHAVGE